MNSDGASSISRLCRAYVSFLDDPCEDALFNWSNALHSMHDRVPKSMKHALFSLGEFIALKALRNHFQHGREVEHQVKVLPVDALPVISDLHLICLIRRESARDAIDKIPPKFKPVQAPLATSALKWYGPCVNIYPAMFNLMANVAVLAREHGVEAPGDEAYRRLAEAVAYDEAMGFSITVEGDIRCPAGLVDDLLGDLLAMN